MAYNAEVRRSVRSSYVHEGISLETAAQKHAVAFGTASRWKRDAKADGDDWDSARAARFLSQEGAAAVTAVVLENFVTLFDSTIKLIREDDKATGLEKAEAISRLSDAYQKTMSAARKGAPEVNKLAVGMDVIKLLADFVGNKFPEHAPAFIDILEPFGTHLAQELI